MLIGNAMSVYKNTPETFWSNAIPSESGCLEWALCRNPDGYGFFCYLGKHWRTHRLAWFLTYGEIPQGLSVLHKCDNPACVRPDHLFLGSQADNVRDMGAKGRTAHREGEYNIKARLTEAQVLEIRTRFANGETNQRVLAEEYGVCQQSISNVILGVTWKHLLEQA